MAIEDDITLDTEAEAALLEGTENGDLINRINDGLSSAKTFLNTAIGTNSTDITAANTNITTVANDLKSAENSITAVEEDVKGAETRLDTIEDSDGQSVAFKGMSDLAFTFVKTGTGNTATYSLVVKSTADSVAYEATLVLKQVKQGK